MQDSPSNFLYQGKLEICSNVNAYFINEKSHWRYPLQGIMWQWHFKNNLQIHQGCCIVSWSFHTELAEIAIATLDTGRKHSKQPQTALYPVWWLSDDVECKQLRRDYLALKDKLSVHKKPISFCRKGIRQYKSQKISCSISSMNSLEQLILNA